MRSLTRYPAAVALLVSVVAAVSCGGAPAAPHPPGALALVVGIRGNMPSPQFTAPAATVIQDSIESGDQVSVVSVSGTPALIQTIQTSRDGCDSRQACDGALSSYTLQIRSALARVKAAAPEADTLEAVDIAARAVAASHGPKHIVVIDSGLQTAGEMPLQAPGGLSVDPAAEAKALSDAHDLEPSLQGVSVLMTGLGETYPPQQALPDGKRQHLYDLWKAVLSAAGADVTIDKTPMQRDKPLAGLPAVTPVSIVDPPPPVQEPCIPIRADQVGFLPSSDQFRDAGQVRQVLQPIADKLSSEHLTATLLGTTALPDDTGPGSLSDRRAAAVKAVLVSLGVPAATLATEGVAENFSAFKPDLDSHGKLIETLAVQNRLVIVEVAGSKC